jgi:hypothetical protein
MALTWREADYETRVRSVQPALRDLYIRAIIHPDPVRQADMRTSIADLRTAIAVACDVPAGDIHPAHGLPAVVRDGWTAYGLTAAKGGA